MNEMDCRWTEGRLQEYVDGDLASAETERCRLHLGLCLRCRREVEGLERLKRRAAHLPRQIEPALDLWPGVEARLCEAERAGGSVAEVPWRRQSEPPGRQRQLRWLAAAALVVLAVSVVAFWHSAMPRRGSPVSSGAERVSEAGTAESSLGSSGAALAGWPADEVADEFSLLRKDLEFLRKRFSRALGARESGLAPESVEVIEKNLTILDGAIAEIQEALREDPSNPRLKLYLAKSYRRELDLLRRAHAYPRYRFEPPAEGPSMEGPAADDSVQEQGA